MKKKVQFETFLFSKILNLPQTVSCTPFRLCNPQIER